MNKKTRFDEVTELCAQVAASVKRGKVRRNCSPTNSAPAPVKPAPVSLLVQYAGMTGETRFAFFRKHAPAIWSEFLNAGSKAPRRT